MAKQPQVILVTGASSGIGEAIARRLIAEGHTVYGAARRVGRMADLEAAGGHALAMDVTDGDSIAAGVQTILAAHGAVDVLVNNAGYAVYGAVEDVPVEQARRQFEVNMFGLARVTQLVLPGMREQRRGKIINMSSMGGKIYTPMGAWYHASKHALEGLSDCLRLELKPFGIHVSVIEPGGIETEFMDVMKEPLLEVSGEGAYAPMARGLVKSGERMYNSGMASSPEVIAKVVSKAVRARRPKTRYAAGLGAKPLLLLRWLLPDRWFDRLVTAM